MADILQCVANKVVLEMQAQGIEATGAAQDMEVRIFKKNTGGLYTVSYIQYALQGRGPGRRPPINAIEDWIEVKGITGDSGQTIRSLAFAIANSIAARGTKAQNRIPESFLVDTFNNCSAGILDDTLEEIGADLLDAVVSQLSKQNKNIKAK